MEMSVKSELCQTKRHVCAVECGSVVAPKSVKRRRRDSRKEPLDGEQNQTALDQPAASNATGTTTVKRSSRFRGVSRHRWTGRYEAHLWDKGSWNPTQRKKGKQVYLGAYDEEESAARAYDLAALKYWGTSTFTNFPVPEYEKEVEIMKTLTKEEYLASLRRRSSGFSRGVSKYRGVARHHHNGRWEARIGRVFGNKYLYLGTYSTQEEAAHAYDIAAIEYRGIHAVTNFDLSTYIRWLRPVSASLAPKRPKSFLVPSAENPDSSTFSLNDNDLIAIKPQELLRPQPAPASPSALGLLLKSAVFRDLVEKNLSAESDAPVMEYRRNDVVSGSDALPVLECQEDSLSEENTVSYCDGRVQGLWNLPFDSSSSVYF